MTHKTFGGKKLAVLGKLLLDELYLICLILKHKLILYVNTIATTNKSNNVVAIVIVSLSIK